MELDDGVKARWALRSDRETAKGDGTQSLQSGNKLRMPRRPERKPALNEYSEEDQGRRAAASVGVDLAIAQDGLGSRGRVCLYGGNNRIRKTTGERVDRRCRGQRVIRVQGAMRRSRYRR